jgi:hypothetical protein
MRNLTHRIVALCGVGFVGVGCASAGAPARSPESAASTQSDKLKIVGNAAEAPFTTVKAAPEIISTCPESKVVSAGSELHFKAEPCSYLLRDLPPATDFELTVALKLGDATAYGIWAGDEWTESGPRGPGIQFDLSTNGLYLAKMESNDRILPKLEMSLDREWHRWRFTRSRQQMVVWLDGRLLLVTNANRQGGAVGLRTYGGKVDARDIETKLISAQGQVAMDGPAGWRVGPTAEQPKGGVTAATPAKPSRMIDGCNLDKIDWQDLQFAASPGTKKAFKLTKGQDAKTVPGRLLQFVGVMPEDLDGQPPMEAMVTIGLKDAQPWQGNSAPPLDPSIAYIYGLSPACEPEALGFVEFDPDDRLRFDDHALQRVRDLGSSFKVDEWRVKGGKLLLTGTKQMGREALDEPLPPCDPAASLAGLGGFAGRKGDELLAADSCVVRKLRERLGKQRWTFEQYTSMALSPLESRAGYLVTEGCQEHACGDHRGAFAVNLSTGAVEAVLFELTEKETLKDVKWLTSNGQPLAPLNAIITSHLADGAPGVTNGDAKPGVPLPRSKHQSPLQGFRVDEAVARLKRADWTCTQPTGGATSSYADVGKKGSLEISNFYATSPRKPGLVTVQVLEFKSNADAKRVYDDMVENNDMNDGAQFLFGDTVLVVLSRDAREKQIAAILSGKPLQAD